MPTLTVGITGTVDGSVDIGPAHVGLYVRNGDVYQVRPAKADPTRRYALYLGNLETDDYPVSEFAKGMAYRLKESELMTPEQAKIFGDRFGRCAWCGYGLDSPESIRRGMGPTCYRRLVAAIGKENL